MGLFEIAQAAVEAETARIAAEQEATQAAASTPAALQAAAQARAATDNKEALFQAKLRTAAIAAVAPWFEAMNIDPDGIEIAAKGRRGDKTNIGWNNDCWVSGNDTSQLYWVLDGRRFEAYVIHDSHESFNPPPSVSIHISVVCEIHYQKSIPTKAWTKEPANTPAELVEALLNERRILELAGIEPTS